MPRPSKRPARILIVDDHIAVRTTIRELLKWHSFEVCGEAQDGDVAVEKTVQFKPDIVVLDIYMPRMNGVAAAHEIRRLRPKTKIVFLSTHNTPVVVRALRAWAHEFVCKADAGIELVPALNRLAGIPPDRPAKVRKSQNYRPPALPKDRSGQDLNASDSIAVDPVAAGGTNGLRGKGEWLGSGGLGESVGGTPKWEAF